MVKSDAVCSVYVWFLGQMYKAKVGRIPLHSLRPWQARFLGRDFRLFSGQYAELSPARGYIASGINCARAGTLCTVLERMLSGLSSYTWCSQACRLIPDALQAVVLYLMLSGLSSFTWCSPGWPLRCTWALWSWRNRYQYPPQSCKY